MGDILLYMFGVVIELNQIFLNYCDIVTSSNTLRPKKIRISGMK